MLIIRARFVGMGDSLEEAAYDVGSGPLRRSRVQATPREEQAPGLDAALVLR